MVRQKWRRQRIKRKENKKDREANCREEEERRKKIKDSRDGQKKKENRQEKEGH